jgi:hypothetical protein
MSAITRTFEREAGNDGVERFYEQHEKGKETAVVQLDLSETAMRELRNPERITVTIERRGRGGGTVIVGDHPFGADELDRRTGGR